MIGPNIFITTELIPKGSTTIVKNNTLLSYIFLYTNFKLNIEIKQLCNAFLGGFRELIPLDWIRMFSTQELQVMISGHEDKKIDFDELQRYTTYSGGYHPSQPYIQVCTVYTSMSPLSTQKSIYAYRL